MKASKLVQILRGEVFTQSTFDPDKELNCAFSCDLMSDALMLLRNVDEAFSEAGILVTGLVTVQGVRTAEMLDLPAIVLVRGKRPNAVVIEEAKKAHIMMIGTKYTMFSANGKMYANGIQGISEYEDAKNV
ncbi:MAG: transcriptional regulator [Bacilli bacterium]